MAELYVAGNNHYSSLGISSVVTVTKFTRLFLPEGYDFVKSIFPSRSSLSLFLLQNSNTLATTLFVSGGGASQTGEVLRTSDSKSPFLIPILKNVRLAAATENALFFVNEQEELVYALNQHIHYPTHRVVIPSLSFATLGKKIKKMSPGYDFLLLLMEDGQVYKISSPKVDEIKLLKSEVAVDNIFTGSRHYGLLCNGKPLMGGLNNNGALGVGDFENRNEPTVISQESSLSKKVCVDMALSFSSSFFLAHDGSVYMGGSFMELQTEIPRRIKIPDGLSQSSSIVSLTASMKNCVAATTRDNQIYCFGDNMYSEFGMSGELSEFTPLKIYRTSHTVLNAFLLGSWCSYLLLGKERVVSLFKIVASFKSDLAIHCCT